jgi:putative DNA primase/helicase
VEIEAACVSILGAITPGPLGAYLRETFSGVADDGLIQRFQVSVYPDPLSDWHNVDRWPDTDAKNRAFEIFERFVNFGNFGTDTPASEIPSLHFDYAAQELFDSWRADLESRLRNSPDDHPIMIAHLGKYRSLMPSLALIFQLCDSNRATAVTLEAAQRAAAWCDLLEAHARRIYHAVTARVDTAARLLGEKIRAKKLGNPFSARDVYRHHWTSLTEPEEVTRAAEVLQDLHWIEEDTPHAEPGGGRPTRRYHVNPRVWL